MYFDPESLEPVDPTDPIDPHWSVPGAFICARLFSYVAREYIHPRIRDFAPQSRFLEKIVYERLFYFCGDEYDVLCRAGMSYDEHLLIPCFPVESEAEIVPDPSSLIGRPSRARPSCLSPSKMGSGLDLTRLAALDVASSIKAEEIPTIRARFGIPDTVAIRVPKPDERACSRSRGEVCFYLAALEGGLRFPIPHIIRDVLFYFNLAPNQIVPNSWRHLVGCASLWAAMSENKTPLTTDVFAHIYQVKESPSGYGWFYFTKRDRIPHLIDVPNSNRYWKDKFFFVSGSGWEFPSWDESRAPQVPRSWGVPPAESEFLLHL